MCNRARVGRSSTTIKPVSVMASARQFCSRAELRAWTSLALLSLSGCALGASLDDEDSFLESLDAAVQTAPAPIIDAGPVYTPLPPELGLPTTPMAPVARPDGGTTTRAPTTGTGTRGTASDAGAARPQQGARDAGSTRPAATGCVESSCKNTCALDGPFNCCTLLDTCGCTWAPGAYCL